MRERVLSLPIPGSVDAEAIFSALFADSTDCFWLDSAAANSSGVPGWSYLGTAASVLTMTGGGGIFQTLRAELAEWSGTDSEGTPGPFKLGLVGWISYEAHSETLGIELPDGHSGSDVMLMRVDRAIAIDHEHGNRAWLLARGAAWVGELALWREEMLALIANLVPVPQTASPHKTVVKWAVSDEEYRERIGLAQRAIANGDAYQLCLTTKVAVSGQIDPLSSYRNLRTLSPSHHSGFLRSNGVALLSASPEMFLRADPDGSVATKPIKGTRPRALGAQSDEAAAFELLNDDKERAENLMIVDLMRNDFSRVCAVGSVAVRDLLTIESYPQVHQLVSTVTGRLDAGRDCVDLLAACFPAGSMTGAPKRAAVEILGGLEGVPRGIYSGVFGYFSCDGAMDLAMVIRSIVVTGGGASVGVGGGITALSDPEREIAEVHLKAAALLEALGASEHAMHSETLVELIEGRSQ